MYIHIIQYIGFHRLHIQHTHIYIIIYIYNITQRNSIIHICVSICKLKLPYGNRSKKRLSSPHKLGYPILINTQRVPLIMDHRLYSDTHPIVSHSISYDMLEFKTRSMDDIITIFGFTMYVCIYIYNKYIYIYMYHYISQISQGWVMSPLQVYQPQHPPVSSPSLATQAPEQLRPAPHALRPEAGGEVFLGQWGNRGNMYMIYCILIYIYIIYIYIYIYIHIQLVYMDILRLNRMLIRIDNMMGVSEIGVYSLWPVEYAKQ